MAIGEVHLCVAVVRIVLLLLIFVIKMYYHACTITISIS
jgi:hypothetical protein